MQKIKSKPAPINYRVDRFDILDEENIGFGMPVPKAAEIAWSYRAIKEREGFSLLHDRQGFRSSLPEHDPLREAWKEAVQVIIPALQQDAGNMYANEADLHYYRFPGLVMGRDVLAVQSPQASYGYMYGCAWLEA